MATPKLWSISRSSGDQLSTSRPQQTSDSVPVATIGPLRASHTWTQNRSHSGTAPPPARPPLIILVSKTSFLLALARRHNLPLIFHIFTSARLHQVAASRSSLHRTGHRSFADATQNCGQSPVFRRPAKQLQTTADFRLGRQVTLAQPSASSQGYRLRRADRSSSPVKAQASVV